MVPVNRQLSKKTWVRGARLKEKEKKETPKDCTTKWLGCAFSLLTYRSMDKGGNRKKKIWEAGVSDPLYPCSVLSPVQAFLRKEFRALSGNQCVTSADNCDKENVCAYIGHHTKICHPPPPQNASERQKQLPFHIHFCLRFPLLSYVNSNKLLPESKSSLWNDLWRHLPLNPVHHNSLNLTPVLSGQV